MVSTSAANWKSFFFTRRLWTESKLTFSSQLRSFHPSRFALPHLRFWCYCWLPNFQSAVLLSQDLPFTHSIQSHLIPLINTFEENVHQLNLVKTVICTFSLIWYESDAIVLECLNMSLWKHVDLVSQIFRHLLSSKKLFKKTFLVTIQIIKDHVPAASANTLHPHIVPV